MPAGFRRRPPSVRGCTVELIDGRVAKEEDAAIEYVGRHGKDEVWDVCVWPADVDDRHDEGREAPPCLVHGCDRPNAEPATCFDENLQLHARSMRRPPLAPL